MTPYRVNEIVIRTGMVGGLTAGCVGTVQFAFALLAPVGLDVSTLRDLGNAGMLASFMTFFLVGLLVRRWTGSVEAATRAGLNAAATACLLSCLTVAALGAFVPSAYAIATAQTALGIDGRGEGTSLLVALATLVVQAVAGFGLAMVGALARRPITVRDRVRRSSARVLRDTRNERPMAAAE
jgi:hypothetical protein